MSFISNETIAVNQKKVTFSVDKATFETAINKVYKKADKHMGKGICIVYRSCN